MSEFESQPKVDRLLGEHIELDVIDPDAIRELLANPQYTTLHRSSETYLPYPMLSTDLSMYTTYGDDSRFQPSADVRFKPPTLHPESWREDVKKEIYAQLAYTSNNDHAEKQDTFIEIPHESNAFYVRISPDEYVRIEMLSTIDSCQISVEIENITTIEEALQRSIEGLPEGVTIDEYQKLIAFVHTWMKVIDSVASVYALEAKVFRKHRLELAVPQKEIPEIMAKHLNPIPEIEQSVSFDKSFAMIGGLTTAKTRLIDIATALKDPEGAADYDITANHFVLYGPPGTGKTTLVEAFAHEAQSQIYHVSSSDLVHGTIGKSAKAVDEMFEEAKEKSAYGRVIIFLDEIDALFGKRGPTDKERIDVVKRFNTGIEDLSENYPNQIIIAGATNVDITQLEDSIVRSGRLEPISAPLPTETERIDVWAAVLAKSLRKFEQIGATSETILDLSDVFSPYGDDLNPLELAKITDGMTGADFTQILSKARAKLYKAYRATGIRDTVTQQHLIDEITQFYRR